MKILFFINSLVGGGAERVLVNLSDEFIKHGHDVTVAIKDNVIAYQLNTDVDIVCFDRIEKGWPKMLLPIVNNLHRIKETKKIIRTTAPDVIIASWGSDLFHILLGHKGIPVIASEHNTFDREHGIIEYVNRYWLNRYVNKVVVLTKYDKAFMARKLKNTIVIPNPLSFKPISIQEYDTTFANRKSILACGRLNAYQVKGFDTLLKSFGLIANKYTEWNIDIAGSGGENDFSRLKNIARECGVEDRLHLLGFHSDIAQVMQQHSIFALTSRSEGFGMVITEAMAMGCACVSFDLTGPSEIILDGIDGVLVDNQDVDAFASALSDLIENKEKRYEIGRRAIDDVRRFDSKMIAERWESIFYTVKA